MSTLQEGLPREADIDERRIDTRNKMGGVEGALHEMTWAVSTDPGMGSGKVLCAVGVDLGRYAPWALDVGALGYEPTMTPVGELPMRLMEAFMGLEHLV